MNLATATARIGQMNRSGKDVFTTADLRVLFPGEKAKTFSEGVRRLVRHGLLERAAAGIYVFSHSTQPKADILERVARAARPFEHSYVSLESALSGHGLISQIQLGNLTVMTTGRSGDIVTPWGRVEFTHTARDLGEVLDSCERRSGMLPMATPLAALRDLRRVGRNLHMIDQDELEDLLSSGGPS